jgi:hypothetical protein
MAGAPECLVKLVPFQISVPKDTYDYLTHLAKIGRLGGREPDIAAHLVVREVNKMLEAGYHNLAYKKA